MTIDFAHYSGREPAFVKHTFLDSYLPALIGKVCSQFEEFVYIDGFAGPWKSKAGENFSDTSFGIAMRHMTAQRRLYSNRGRHITMRAFLVEKDASSFRQLEQAIDQFSEIHITPLFGMIEDHASTIASSIPQTAFSFTLIDPKGFPDIAAIMPLLNLRRSESLVNFMFDFANRFADTDLLPKLEAWLSALGSTDWREQVEGFSGAERGGKLERLAARALQVTGGYAYAPVVSVDKVHQNRTLYKLIFLSRHSDGLKVFRDSEQKALDAQAKARSAVKAQRKAERSTNHELFLDGSDAIPNDRSSLIITRGQTQANERLTEILAAAGPTGLSWRKLWPPILEELPVTLSWLGRKVNDLRSSGSVLAPNWPSERKKIPGDSQLLIWKGAPM